MPTMLSIISEKGQTEWEQVDQASKPNGNTLSDSLATVCLSCCSTHIAPITAVKRNVLLHSR